MHVLRLTNLCPRANSVSAFNLRWRAIAPSPRHLRSALRNRVQPLGIALAVDRETNTGEVRHGSTRPQWILAIALMSLACSRDATELPVAPSPIGSLNVEDICDVGLHRGRVGPAPL